MTRLFWTLVALFPLPAVALIFAQPTLGEGLYEPNCVKTDVIAHGESQERCLDQGSYKG